MSLEHVRFPTIRVHGKQRRFLSEFLETRDGLVSTSA